LEPSGDRYQLRVKDDGIGFSQNDGKPIVMGIRIMQYRARVIGASLTLNTQPGSGTDIACLFVPVSGEWPQKPELRARHENGSAARLVT
jgi:nitrate/nitrite-specific signal transduction histidine kinase